MSEVKISLFIPCIPLHFKTAVDSVREYLSADRKPDEIVIGLSQACECPVGDRYRAKQKFGDVLKIIEIDEPLDPGPCRQLAKEHTSGDIIVYSDADDFPFSRRIEEIEKVFDSTDAMMVNHGYLFPYEKSNLQSYSKELHDCSKWYDFYFPEGKITGIKNRIGCFGDRPEGKSIRTALGPVAIRREVLDKVHWKIRRGLTHFDAGEDLEFCIEVFHTYNKSFIIDDCLYWYVQRRKITNG
jgi:hypothetical protein